MSEQGKDNVKSLVNYYQSRKIHAPGTNFNNRCSKCGFKIRGKNHDEGQHHKLANIIGRNRHAHIGPTRRSGKGK